jgi:hypothetical protein
LREEEEEGSGKKAEERDVASGVRRTLEGVSELKS